MQLLIDGKHELGEAVLWCERSGRVFWTDIPAARLWCHAPALGLTQSWAMPERLATFAFTEDDDVLLLGLASQLAFFRFSTGAITPICRVEADLPETRVNDGRCDRQGRFVFGTFNQASGHAPVGAFYRLNLNLVLERLPLEGVGIANSICFSPDGGTMYHCDSATCIIRCCAYDPASGAITDDRVFVDLRGGAGEPDGSVVDAQGCLWNASWGDGRIVRYTPDGRVERTITVPALQPSCVAFGGSDFSTLYATTARLNMSDALLIGQPAAGGVFHALFDDVRGMPSDRFAGALSI